MKQWRTSVRNACKLRLRHTCVKLSIYEMSPDGKKKTGKYNANMSRVGGIIYKPFGKKMPWNIY